LTASFDSTFEQPIKCYDIEVLDHEGELVFMHMGPLTLEELEEKTLEALKAMRRIYGE